MPYYRIIIWTKDRNKPYSGIRQIAQTNIDMVFNMVEKDVYSHFSQHLLIDFEVQMLSKRCTAVKRYLEQLNRMNSKR